MKYEDRENGLKCVLKMNKLTRDTKGKRVHDIFGEIFKFRMSLSMKRKDRNTQKINHWWLVG